MQKLSSRLLVSLCLAWPFSLAAPGFAQASAAATPKRPMTFEDMMHMKRLGDTAVSPDGKWLAYSAVNVDLAQNTRTSEIWLQKIEGGEALKLSVGRPGDSSPRFAPDGRSVLFLSSRAGGQQVWLANFDTATGATTSARKLTNIATEADNAQWSPDGKWIAFTSAVYPDCPPIMAGDFDSGDRCNSDRDAAAASSKVKAQIFTAPLYRHWNRYMGEKKSHIFLVAADSGTIHDLNPGETHDVPPYSVEGGGNFAFAPDSKELAFTEKLVENEAITTNTDIFTVDLTNPMARPLKVSTSPGADANPAYSPDGKFLAWRSQARNGYESDKWRLLLYDRGKKTITDLLPKFDNWVNELAWAPDSHSIYFSSDFVGESPVFQIDVAGETLNILTVGNGEFSDLHPLANPGSLLATRTTVAEPGEVVVIDDSPASVAIFPKNRKDEEALFAHGYPSAKTVGRVTLLNDALLSKLDLGGMESFWFTVKDGAKVQGFLIRPPGFDAAKKYPVKFLIHGGPEGNWGEAWSYRWNAELFAANGYVVIMINPRGSSGYGQDFIDAINGDWGGKPFNDLMTGLDYAEQHYSFIDKTRECALGASYGGYMANWIMGHTTRFQCLVSHDGMFNPESAYGSTEEEWFNEWEYQGKPWDYYGKPDSENPYRKWSPALSAKNFKTPTLVIHGQLDYRLDVSEGLQLFDTLQRIGVPSKMLYFPDEGHWVLKPQNSELWYKTVNDWVDQWVKEAATSR